MVKLIINLFRGAGIFSLLFSIVLNTSCSTEKRLQKLAKDCANNFPCKTDSITTITRDTTIQVDTLTETIVVDCDSIIKANGYVIYKDGHTKQDTSYSKKGNVVIRYVKIPMITKTFNEERNTLLMQIDSARVTMFKDSLFKLQAELIEKDKELQSYDKKLSGRTKWFISFLVLFLVSLIFNILQFKFRK